MRTRPGPRTPSEGPSSTPAKTPTPDSTTRRKATAARDTIAARDSTAVRLAALGLVVAVIALALGLRSTFFGGSTASSCQTLAWNSVPGAGALPSGWSIAGSTFTSAGLSSKLSGPAPADGSSAGTTVYATVDCLGDQASNAVTRNRAAAGAAGQSVAAVEGLGDAAYSTTDPTTGGMAIEFRRGNLVTYVAATGTIDPTALQAIATAFDSAMQSAIAGATPGPAAAAGASPADSSGPDASPLSSDIAGESPAASAAAPELEALLPATIDTTVLTRSSAIGVDNLGTDPKTRALSADLHSLGADPANLHIAAAYDASGAIDLSMLAFGMSGITIAQLKTAVLTTWLSAQDPGVKTSTVSLSGHPSTAVDYGDQGTISYVVVIGNSVLVIETADRSLADKAGAALH